MRTEDVVLTKGQKFKVCMLVIRDIIKGTLVLAIDYWTIVLPAVITVVLCCLNQFKTQDGSTVSLFEQIFLTLLSMFVMSFLGAVIGHVVSAIWRASKRYFIEQFAVYEAEEKERTLKDGVDKVILDE